MRKHAKKEGFPTPNFYKCNTIEEAVGYYKMHGCKMIIKPLKVKGIQLNVIQPDIETNYAYFPVIIHEKEFGSTRNEVAKALINNGFIPRKSFYLLTNTFECYHGKYDVNDTPVALHISKHVLTLPLYPDLPLDIVDRICDVIGGCCK